MAVAAIIGYLLGSIPTAQIVARFFRVNPLASGDGNPGWLNMRGLVGERAAAIVLAGDLLKGTVAAIAGLLLWGDLWWTPYIALGAALVGHAFPLFGGFRGGRGALTFAGGMLVLAPWAVLLAALVGVGAWFLTRKETAATVAAAVAFLPAQYLVDDPARVMTAAGLGAFVLLRLAYGHAISRNPTAAAA